MDQEPAYILNRRIFKESSLLIDVITPNFGVISLVANGALKQQRGWSGLLQVFQPLLVTWSGRSALKTLTSVEMPGIPLKLRNKHLFSAYYVNELVLKILPKGEGVKLDHTHSFIAYTKVLNDLEQADQLEPPLRYFEFLLLSDLDLLPDFTVDIDGDAILAENLYYYVENQGFTKNTSIQFPNEQEQYGGAFILELNIFDDGIFSSQECSQKLKRLMRRVIQAHLGNYEFKSRALFN